MNKMDMKNLKIIKFLKKTPFAFRISFFFVILFIIWALLSEMFFKSDPIVDIEKELLPLFSPGHILGTDIYGRDLFSILSKGLAHSLSLSVFVSVMNSLIGIFIGHLIVTGPRLLNLLLQFLTNIIFIFPSILVAIIFMSFVESSFWGLSFVLIFTGWPAMAKISSGEIQRIMVMPFVEASKSIGRDNMGILFSIILPNILPQIFLHTVLSLSGIIISEATLGFLGLGASEYSWGNLLNMSRSVILEAPHILIIMSFFLGLLIVSINICGDSLKKILDPKMKARK